jgi:hypothetical protein
MSISSCNEGYGQDLSIESVWNLAFGGGEKKIKRKLVWLP